MKTNLFKKMYRGTVSAVLAISLCLGMATPAFAVSQEIKIGTNNYSYNKHYSGGLAECFAPDGYCMLSIFAGINTYPNDKLTPSEIPETIEGYPVVCMRTAYKASDTEPSTPTVVYAPEIPKYMQDMDLAFMNSRIPNPPSKIPDMVVTLGSAFANCIQMRSFPALGSSIENMSNSFSGCVSAVGTVTLPESVKDIRSAFMNCKKMSEIPDISGLVNVENIESAFNGCAGAVGGTDLPNASYKSIEGLFSGCVKMTRPPRVIPANVTTMRSTFADCQNLTGTIDIRADISAAAPNNYANAFKGAATAPGCELILNYTAANESAIDDIIAKKIITSNVKKGKLITDEVVNEQTVAEVKRLITSELDSFTATNETTSDDLQSLADGVITNENIAVGVSGFDKAEAVADADGSVTAKMDILLSGTTQESIPVELVIPAIGGGAGDGGDTGTGLPVPDGSATQDVVIRGVVEPINTIDVDVPLNLTFTINENRNIHYTKNAKITSNSPAPLTVSSLGVTVPNGAPNLVADDAFPDWDRLTMSQTKNNLAVSINKVNLSTSGVKLGDIASGYNAPAELPLNLSVLYGKLWPNTTLLTFDYVMNLEIALAE